MLFIEGGIVGAGEGCCHFYSNEKEGSFLNDCCLKVLHGFWSLVKILGYIFFILCIYVQKDRYIFDISGDFYITTNFRKTFRRQSASGLQYNSRSFCKVADNSQHSHWRVRIESIQGDSQN